MLVRVIAEAPTAAKQNFPSKALGIVARIGVSPVPTSTEDWQCGTSSGPQFIRVVCLHSGFDILTLASEETAVPQLLRHSVGLQLLKLEIRLCWALYHPVR